MNSFEYIHDGRRVRIQSTNSDDTCVVSPVEGDVDNVRRVSKLDLKISDKREFITQQLTFVVQLGWFMHVYPDGCNNNRMMALVEKLTENFSYTLEPKLVSFRKFCVAASFQQVTLYDGNGPSAFLRRVPIVDGACHVVNNVVVETIMLFPEVVSFDDKHKGLTLFCNNRAYHYKYEWYSLFAEVDVVQSFLSCDFARAMILVWLEAMWCVVRYQHAVEFCFDSQLLLVSSTCHVCSLHVPFESFLSVMNAEHTVCAVVHMIGTPIESYSSFKETMLTHMRADEHDSRLSTPRSFLFAQIAYGNHLVRKARQILPNDTEFEILDKAIRYIIGTSDDIKRVVEDNVVALDKEHEYLHPSAHVYLKSGLWQLLALCDAVLFYNQTLEIRRVMPFMIGVTCDIAHLPLTMPSFELPLVVFVGIKIRADRHAALKRIAHQWSATLYDDIMDALEETYSMDKMQKGTRQATDAVKGATTPSRTGSTKKAKKRNL